MPARVLFVGFDAAEASLLERWAAEGHLPAFARLAADATRCAMETPLETLPGAIWPEIVTGRSGGKLGRFYHSRQLHTGEAELRPIALEDVDPRDYFWSVASRAGRRVAVIDLPQVVPCPDLNGVQVSEWGCHDRQFQIRSVPPGLISELVARHGDHPVTSCDHFHGRTHSGYERLLDALVTGVRRKADLILDVLARETWDLFACAFSESHCVGHQFWSFFDPADPGHDPDAPAALSHAIRSVYVELDRALARILEAAGPDARALVVASHGMGLKTAGPQLLPEVLQRLGLYRPKRAGLRVRLRDAIPRAWRERALGWLPQGAPRSLAPLIGRRPESLDVAGVRAIPVPNNRCGGIRLNLAGREPHGSVEPGAQAEALIAELRRELLSLWDPATGEPIVERVQTAREIFGSDHHPDLPDLIVVFRSDLGLVEACESPRVGRIEVTARPPHPPRSGDHRPSARLWALAPGVSSETRLPVHDVLDIAPTLLGLLGLPPAPGCDGRAIPELVRAPAQAATGL